MLPVRVIVYLTAELIGLKFWKLWKDIHKSVYQDQIMKKYVSDELMGKPDYYISDDDRFYWWDGSDEVKVSYLFW